MGSLPCLVDWRWHYAYDYHLYHHSIIIMMNIVTEGGSMLLYFKPGSHPWDTRIQVKLRMSYQKKTLSNPSPIVALPCQLLSHFNALVGFCSRFEVELT